MKKQAFLFPLIGLLLTGCNPPVLEGTQQAGNGVSIGSGTPSQTCSGMTSAPTTESPASGEESSNSDFAYYLSSMIEEMESSLQNYSSAIYRKPIIYFYPEEAMDLEVTYVEEERLLTTYPKYDHGWNIHLKEDGNFTLDGSDREYYALYFDEVGNFEWDYNEGFYVTKENAISFLEEKMDYIGFTNREVDEFIMYWLPILENNGQSLVYFEQTEERNEECPLEFSVAPTSLIRTLIHIKKVDEETPIKEQELRHYERTGFTVTEWGGVEY